MNFKETIISSFFFHLILFLLMTAVSSYTTGISGKLQNIISVDLSADDSKAMPAAEADSGDEPPLVYSPPSNGEVSLSDPAADNPPVESEKNEPEKKAEPTDLAKNEKAEQPTAQTGGFTSLLEYYQFIMLHKKIFVQKAGTRVNQLIGEALKENKRNFYGGTAIVSLKFAPDGKLSGVFVDSASPELKAFLEEVGWVAVPAPAAYSLRDTAVQIEFTVLEGYLNFNIKAL